MSELHVAHQFDDAGQQRHADVMGMWIFLATELLLFGGLFTAFMVNRYLHAGAFGEAAGHLDLLLGSVNTAVLITSGLTMALAETAVAQSARRAVLTLLAATLVLGLAFLAIKGYEWHAEYSEGLVPLLGLDFRYPGEHPDAARMFFSLYFAMTGLHAAHMALGLGVIAVMFVLVWRWRRPDTLVRQIQITGMYWAFVDIVWMFVFTTLYLLRT